MQIKWHSHIPKSDSNPIVLVNIKLHGENSTFNRQMSLYEMFEDVKMKIETSKLQVPSIQYCLRIIKRNNDWIPFPKIL